ncbi:hypothetical protein BGX38DRAFT_1180511 [Terfezia claveryi]|nr:hypothetical protein BGX38DRAFT_1180511 [Terfezia claveryi]
MATYRKGSPPPHSHNQTTLTQPGTSASGLGGSLRSRLRSEKDKASTRSKYFEWSEEDELASNYSNYSTRHEEAGLGKIEDEIHVAVGEDEDDMDEASMASKQRRNKRKSGTASQRADKQVKKARPTIGQIPGDYPTGDCKGSDADLIGNEYRDNIIHPNTMAFLKELGKHNNRPWFAENEILYRTAKQDFESFIEKLSQKIIEEVDTTVPELPLKDLIFRIYRDIRFSNDQTPYKIYFSAAWSRTGRKGPYAHYYIQIQPYGKSMIGGGIWHADAPPLRLLRRAISKRPGQLKQILLMDEIARDFLDIKGHDDEQRVIDAFVARNSEDALKTAPKGFPKDHPEIALLRLRSFTVGRHLTDDEVSNPGFLHQTVDLLSKMEPFITYLNSIVMPDMNMDNSSEDIETNA